MKHSCRFTLSVALVATFLLLPGATPPALAQWGPGPVPANRTSQANAIASVRAQIGWLQNATRNASSRNADPAGTVWQKFDAVRAAYAGFTMTLTPEQAAHGANELAELSAGLDIIAEAFSNYQNDLSTGRSASAALQDLCQVLNQASGVWLQQFNKSCRSLHIG